jgi:NusA-like KH domain protein
MTKVLDMQFIRYANIFDKVTNIRTNHCFEYNNTIIFAVPRKFVMMAIGMDNCNLKRLSEIIGKRVKIVAIPNGNEDMESFISVVTHPVKFKAVEIKDGEVIINSSSQSKASLIGRDKRRLKEMENIIEQYFGIKRLRIK